MHLTTSSECQSSLPNETTDCRGSLGRYKKPRREKNEDNNSTVKWSTKRLDF